MAESPDVIVHAANLGGETPVAVRDGLSRYELAIDFSWPEEQIAAGLQTLFQRAVDSGRWTRRNTSEHREAQDADEEAAPHPEGDLD